MKYSATPPAFLVTLLALLALSSCNRDRIACQSPPPQYAFAFVTAQGQPLVTDSLQAASIQLVYISPSGSRSVVPRSNFKPVPVNESYRYAYALSYDLIGASTDAQTIQYSLEHNGQRLNTLSLSTERNKDKCDGWMHLTNVQYNQLPVPISTDNITYKITVDR